MLSKKMDNGGYNTLVIGPGGVRGFHMLGALKVLETHQILADVHYFCGVSVGALISFYLTLGCRIDKILDDASLLNFMDIIGDLTVDAIIKGKGLFSHKEIEDPLRAIANEKFDTPIINFHDHHRLTGKHLTIVSFNSDTNETTYFNIDNTPTIDVIDAILASVSIPVIFQEYKICGDVYVDGVFGDPYPVKRYDVDGNKILGISIRTLRPHGCNAIERVPRLIANLIDMLRDEKNLTCSHRVHHLTLTTSFVGKFGVVASDEDKLHLISDGTEQGMDFLDRSRTGKMSVPHNKIPPPVSF